MVVSDGTRPGLDSVDPPFLTEPTYVTGSLETPVREPALARLLDWAHRWRLGLVVLAPLIVGMAALAYLNQGPRDQGSLQARGQGSAVQPLIAGVVGAPPRTGAATGSGGPADSEEAAAATSPEQDSFDAVTPAPSPPKSSGSGPRQSGNTDPKGDAPVTPARVTTTTGSAPEGASTTLETARPTTAPAAETTITRPPTTQVKTTAPPSTAPKVEVTAPQKTEPPPPPPKPVCVVTVKGGKKLYAAPTKKSDDIAKADKGVYVVSAVDGDGKDAWYRIAAAGTVGWVKYKDTEKDYHCSS